MSRPTHLRRLEREELLVREALVDRLAERVDRDERDDRERGQEQQPREPRLPALELRRSRRRRGAGAGVATVVIGVRRGRMADATLPRVDVGSATRTSRWSRRLDRRQHALRGLPFRIWLMPW